MSAQEQVDIVDEKDVPTGRVVTLSQAHREILPHRIAAVLVFRPNGNLIVQVHKYHGRRLDHSVGGHVSAGEDYGTAAQREMEEELRLTTPLKTIAEGVVSREDYPKTGDKVVHVFGVFTTQISKDWQLVETEEVDQILEMGVEELIHDMNTNPDRYLQGFFTSLGAYLTSIESDLKITAYGKTWGEL